MADTSEPVDDAPRDEIDDLDPVAPEPDDDRRGHGAEQRHYPFGPEP